MNAAALSSWTLRVPRRVFRSSSGSLRCGPTLAAGSCSAASRVDGRPFAVTAVSRQHVDPQPNDDLAQLLRDLDRASQSFGLTSSLHPSTAIPEAEPELDDEEVARNARRLFKEQLPEGFLSATQYKSYERMFGTPEMISATDIDMEDGTMIDETELATGTGVLREAEDGSLEEVEYLSEAEDQEFEEAEEFEQPGSAEALEAVLNSPEMIRLRKSKKGKFFARAKKTELDNTILYAEMTRADEAMLRDLDKEWKQMDEDEQTMYLDDVRYLKLERYLRTSKREEEADELLRCLYIQIEAQARAEAERREADLKEDGGHNVAEEQDSETTEDPEDAGEATQRIHPLTQQNRFTTFPANVTLPQSVLVGPVSAIVAGASPVHLAEASLRVFGGAGLPYSASNPAFAKTIPQKPIPLNPSMDRMSEIEADAYFAAVMPGTYASIMSVLVESRKRLGSEWLKGLLEKEGGPRILDAGSAGAGAIAFQSILHAEWARIHEESMRAETQVATAGGQTGAEPIRPPTGKVTVLTSSEAMRKRASALLDNTTFVPRLPDYLHASNSNAARLGKFDIIIAPHALWPLNEEYLRKQYVANLWSMLSADGGLLVLIEKGVPRGFECIAGARKFLLDTRIASPGDLTVAVAQEVIEPGEEEIFHIREKGKGMIIAPCTNHAGCPMYTKPGLSIGRKDYCHFEQRYTRPPYLQRILNAKDKNHEDVHFSYLSVMRGRDLRDGDDKHSVTQGDMATTRAFSGYERSATDETESFDPTAPVLEEPDGQGEADPNQALPSAPRLSFMLPRAVLPPLKRTGHVVLDLCTPSGTLERWTVPRSFSKQAYRDARKSHWGDLWALGAKTRVARAVRLGTNDKGEKKAEGGGGGAGKGARAASSSSAGTTIDLKAVTLSKKARRKLAEQPVKAKRKRAGPATFYDVPVDGESGRVQLEDIKALRTGRMRLGPKISGVRDKRDKTGKGLGRRKTGREE